LYGGRGDGRDEKNGKKGRKMLALFLLGGFRGVKEA
jgi:hypothetical protein